MKCSVCAKDKNELTPKKSKLSGSPLYLCTECLDNKREPRYLIIIYGRAQGIIHVLPYIKEHRYVGKEILASELV